MMPWLDDGDVTLYLGDALETVRGLPDESVDCVVTSPPYWGLRDYGTGEWDGGDPDCDHIAQANRDDRPRHGLTGGTSTVEASTIYRQECGKCGARRVDQQMGLEPTPDLFVAGMVELFREIRRVLAAHGTCWVNLGDSYAASMTSDRRMFQPTRDNDRSGGVAQRREPQIAPQNTAVNGLKPKDLVGIPWRVAFALQADGWWLRSDIIWAKPNPMPESVTDRPTKAHEYIFLLTKQPRYWFDTEAVREPAPNNTNKHMASNRYDHTKGLNNSDKPEGTFGVGEPRLSRNVRSVWTIATQPYPEAHFATYPEELARRAILAGCPLRVCRVCGKPSERIVELTPEYTEWKQSEARAAYKGLDDVDANSRSSRTNSQTVPTKNETVGWSDCGHNSWRPGVTLDPFIGSGTTAKVARDHQRHAIGIDLNREYLELAARRLQQLSLLT